MLASSLDPLTCQKKEEMAINFLYIRTYRGRERTHTHTHTHTRDIQWHVIGSPRDTATLHTRSTSYPLSDGQLNKGLSRASTEIMPGGLGRLLLIAGPEIHRGGGERGGGGEATLDAEPTVGRGRSAGGAFLNGVSETVCLVISEGEPTNYQRGRQE